MMDIDSLRKELEEQLKRNPHPEAPEGFRDRFEQAVEHHQAETDAGDKAELEAQLKRIRDEAEAAANAARGDSADAPDIPRPREVPVDEPAPRGPDDDIGTVPVRGSKTRLGLIAAAVAAAAAAAFYFYSGSS